MTRLTDWLENITALTNRWLEGQRTIAEAQSRLFALAGIWLDGNARDAGAATSAASAANDAHVTNELAEGWLRFWRMQVRLLAPQGSPDVAGATLARLLSMPWTSGRQWTEIGRTIESLAAGPRFSDIGGTERQQLSLFARWLALQQASQAYYGIVAAAWLGAVRRFGDEVAARGEKGLVIDSFRALVDVWIDVANRVLLETQRSEAFLDAQRKMLRAGLDFQLQQREAADRCAEALGRPTRAEIDEIHKSVAQLKRTVRALERAAGVQLVGKADRESAGDEPPERYRKAGS